MTMKEWKTSSLYRPQPMAPEEAALMKEVLAGIESVRPSGPADRKKTPEPAAEAVQAG